MKSAVIAVVCFIAGVIGSALWTSEPSVPTDSLNPRPVQEIVPALRIDAPAVEVEPLTPPVRVERTPVTVEPPQELLDKIADLEAQLSERNAKIADLEEQLARLRLEIASAPALQVLAGPAEMLPDEVASVVRRSKLFQSASDMQDLSSFLVSGTIEPGKAYEIIDEVDRTLRRQEDQRVIAQHLADDANRTRTLDDLKPKQLQEREALLAKLQTSGLPICAVENFRRLVY